MILKNKQHDKTMSFSLRFTLDTSGMAPAPHEQFPVVRLWTSYSDHHDVVAAGVRPGEVVSETAVFGAVPAPRKETARADDAIWFGAMALEATENGTRQVRQRVASGFVYYSELVRAANAKTSVKLDLAAFNWYDQEGRRFKKAEMQIEPIGQLTQHPDTQLEDVQYLPQRDKLIQGVMESAIRRSIDFYTKDGLARGAGLSAEDPKNKLVHAPAWNGPTGFRPGYMYFVHPKARVSRTIDADLVSHMRYVLKAALWRAARTEEWFLRVVEAQLARKDDQYDDDFTLCCDVLGEAFCAAATSLPYIGDTVNSARRSTGGALSGVFVHPVESFDFACVRGGGDCEDLARLIHAYRCALADGEWDDPLCAAASQVTKLYAGFGVLTSVLGAQLSDAHRGDPYVLGTRRDDDVKVGAHMYYQMIPLGKVAILIRRVQPDADLDALIGEPLAEMAAWRDKMPHLVLEGTGMLQTLQRPLASYPVSMKTKAQWRDWAAKQDAAEHLFVRKAVAPWNGCVIPLLNVLAQTVRRQRKLDRLPNARVGGFYRDVVHLYTDDFMKRGFNTAEFLVVNLGEPERVPVDAAPDYSDDTMLQTQEAVQPEESAIAARLEHLHRTINPHVLEAAAPAPSWRRLGGTSAESMLNSAALVQGKPEQERMDRFPYGTNERATATYGVPLTDMLQDRPMLSHVGLAAGPPLEGAAAAVVGLHYRHAEPVPLAGEQDFLKRVAEEQEESERVGGIDVSARREATQDGVDRVRKELQAMFPGEWPIAETLQSASLVPVTLFVNTRLLSNPAVVRFVMACLGGIKGDVQSARSAIEEFIPGKQNLVLQFAVRDAAVSPFMK